jgi:hypothetical protein
MASAGGKGHESNQNLADHVMKVCPDDALLFQPGPEAMWPGLVEPIRNAN